MSNMLFFFMDRGSGGRERRGGGEGVGAGCTLSVVAVGWGGGQYSQKLLRSVLDYSGLI